MFLLIFKKKDIPLNGYIINKKKFSPYTFGKFYFAPIWSL
jgi:hypothetical protein